MGDQKEIEEEQAARKAAIKEKMREALVSAAMMEMSQIQGKMMAGKRKESLPGQKPVQGQDRRGSQPNSIVRRGSNTGDTENRSTIWEFFEEGKKRILQNLWICGGV